MWFWVLGMFVISGAYQDAEMNPNGPSKIRSVSTPD
jgi:hypothetical protein